MEKLLKMVDYFRLLQDFGSLAFIAFITYEVISQILNIYRILTGQKEAQPESEADQIESSDVAATLILLIRSDLKMEKGKIAA